MASLVHAVSERAATKAPPPAHRRRARRADDRIEAQFEDEDAPDEAPEDFDTEESENDGAEEPEDEEEPADDDEGRRKTTTGRGPVQQQGDGRRPLAAQRRTMAPSKSGQPNDVVDRYRQTAEVALDQLEWAIRYLERIRKPEIAGVLAKNHAHIRRQLLDRPEQRQADQHTSET